MDFRKALSVKSLGELLTITTSLSYNNKRKPEISKRKRSEWYEITVCILYFLHTS